MKTNYGKFILFLSLGLNIGSILILIEALINTKPDIAIYVLNSFTSITLASGITEYIYKQINKNLKND